MKLMQLKYPCVQKVEVEMKKQDEAKIPPPTAGITHIKFFTVYCSMLNYLHFLLLKIQLV